MDGIARTRREIRSALSTVRKATARGITKTLIEVDQTLQREMRRVFAQPIKPYILKAFRVQPAEAKDLRGLIELRRDPQYSVHPLTPQVLGGTRSIKRFERALQAKASMPLGWYAVPMNAALVNGRVQAGLVQQIVAQAGQQQKAGGAFGPVKRGDKRTARRKREAMGRAGGQFVFVLQRRGRLAPGVYRAEGRDFGAKLGFGRTGKLVPIFRFVPRVGYTKRLDFFEIGEKIIHQRLSPNIESSLMGANLLRG